MNHKIITACLASLLLQPALTPQADDLWTADRFRGIAFRGIGPNLTTGRIADLEVDPNDPSVWYLAAGSGGLFKTVNRGNTWTPIFDEYPSYSLGCVVVDPRNSKVVWLGTGENTTTRYPQRVDLDLAP